MKRRFTAILGVIALVSLVSLALGQEEPKPLREYRDVGSRILELLYSVAHYIGVGIVKIIDMIIPNVAMPKELIDPLGFLALLAIFLVAAQVARKLAWIVVVVGRVLMVVRVVPVIVQGAWVE